MSENEQEQDKKGSLVIKKADIIEFWIVREQKDIASINIELADGTALKLDLLENGNYSVSYPESDISFHHPELIKSDIIITESNILFAKAIIGLSDFIKNLEKDGLTFDQIIMLVYEGIPYKQRTNKTNIRNTLESLQRLAKQFKK